MNIFLYQTTTTTTTTVIRLPFQDNLGQPVPEMIKQSNYR